MKELNLEEKLKHSYSETIEYLLANGKREYMFYFSFNTVNNLIIHFNRLNDDAKLHVYNTLVSYFDEIKTLPIDDIKQVTKDMANQYIEPLVLKYYLKMGFVVLMTRDAYIFIYVCIFIVLLIFFSLPIYLYILIALIMAAFQLWISIKKKKNLVYGYKY